MRRILRYGTCRYRGTRPAKAGAFYEVVSCQPPIFRLIAFPSRRIRSEAIWNISLITRGLVSAARSRQGRAPFVRAAKRTLDGEDGGPTIRLSAKCSRMCILSNYAIASFFFVWPGFLKAIVRSPSIRVGFHPYTTCAMRETSLVEATPSTKSGLLTPAPARALLHQSKIITLSKSQSAFPAVIYAATARLITAPAGTIPRSR